MSSLQWDWSDSGARQTNTTAGWGGQVSRLIATSLINNLLTDMKLWDRTSIKIFTRASPTEAVRSVYSQQAHSVRLTHHTDKYINLDQPPTPRSLLCFTLTTKKSVRWCTAAMWFVRRIWHTSKGWMDFWPFDQEPWKRNYCKTAWRSDMDGDGEIEGCVRISEGDASF